MLLDTKIFLGVKNRIKDYLILTKPTITLLVLITVIPSYILAEGLEKTQTLTLSFCLLGVMLLSSSAAIFNQILERASDKNMERTKNRALASGRISKAEALFLASLFGLGGFFILKVQTTLLAALLALSGHVFYTLMYTLYLKPRTVQNIVIGGAAGAVGPLIGWAAAADTVAWPAYLLFALIFAWTPPHFWALSLKYKKDYAQANIPMYPNLYGDDKTRRAIFLYSLSLLPIAILLSFWSAISLFFIGFSTVLTLVFILKAWRLYRAKNNDQAMPFFHFSCLYIFIYFCALTLDSLWPLFLKQVAKFT